MQQTFNQRVITFFILILNIPAAMTIDEHAPSMPAMVHALHSSVSAMQLTITLYMLGMALSQWVCGALSDRFGRRPVLLATAVIYLLASVLCVFSKDFTEVLLGRFLQGVGAGCFALIAPALMGEALAKDRLDRVSSYFSMSYALLPIIAPVIGGYIQDYFSWQANFIFMFLVTFIITVLVWWKLPETHTPTEQHQLNLRQLLKNYTTVLTNKNYMTAVICMVFAWSTIIAFSVLAPFLLQNVLGLSAISYGHYALLVGLGFFVGNNLNNLLLKKLNTAAIIKWGLGSAIVICIVQLLLLLAGQFNIGTVIIPTFLLMCAIGMIFPGLYGRAATVFTDLVGVASALIGCLILIGAVIITSVLTVLEAHSAVTLASVYLALCVLCTGTYFVGQKDQNKICFIKQWYYTHHRWIKPG